jgi:hypothetical protein
VEADRQGGQGPPRAVVPGIRRRSRRRKRSRSNIFIFVIYQSLLSFRYLGLFNKLAGWFKNIFLLFSHFWVRGDRKRKPVKHLNI